MRRTTRLLAGLMAIVFLVMSLAGCSKKQSGDNVGNGEEDKPDFVYQASYFPISDDIEYVNASAYHEGRLYFTAETVSGTEKETDPATGEEWEYDVYATGLYSVNEDGTDLKKLENYEPTPIPEGFEGNASINMMTVDDQGNVWVLENLYTYYFDTPENGGENSGGDYEILPADAGGAEATAEVKTAYADASGTVDDKWNYYVEGEQKYYVRKLDTTGAELQRIDASDMKSADSENFYISQMNVDSAGNIYLSSDTSIYVLDNSGGKLFTLEPEGWLNGLTRLADGRIAAMFYDESSGGNKLSAIDVAAKDLGESYDAPMNAYGFYPGTGDYDLYYSTDINFFGYNIKTGESVNLFNWINCDVDGNYVSNIRPLDDGRFVGFYHDGDTGEGGTQIIVMTKTDASQVAEKTILSYACMYLDWNVRRQILKFNKSNEEYRIEVEDYSQYNTEEDYTAGLKKLTTEILTGKIPDIIDTNQMPVSQMAAKGILEDLWPYIDEDSELGGRDVLMTQVFSAYEREGKLYQIFPNFSISTVMGATSLVGEEMGWTLDELYETLQSMPEGAEVFSQSSTKAEVLSYCCTMMLDGLVNWETGECRFDSDEFKSILKFTDLFQKEFDWENFDQEGDYESDYSRLSSGKQMLLYSAISDFQSFQMYKAMFGGAVTYKGFPTGEGNGSAFSLSGASLAMSSACKDKDGAWQFMREILTENYQADNTWSFPTNKAAFEKMMNTAMTPEYNIDPETGEKTEISKGNWGWDELNVEIYAMTQEEADQIMELINTTNRVYSYDESIYEIINQEAAAYFDGKKTVDDVAKNIQSRVSLYVNEQR